MNRFDDILTFWFGSGAALERRQIWFAADPIFDRQCIEQFGADYALAAAGRLADWCDEARSSLALVLLLDQFPRNLFRGTPQAFGNDAAALATARLAIAAGFDHQVRSLERAFFYLPFEHSERFADQRESVRLAAALARADPSCVEFLRFAEAHREVIRRFGRFPHRNAILGRESTAQELEYLRDHPGF
jgi:uncharacterized protein (DUF924 family)